MCAFEHKYISLITFNFHFRFYLCNLTLGFFFFLESMDGFYDTRKFLINIDYQLLNYSIEVLSFILKQRND